MELLTYESKSNEGITNLKVREYVEKLIETEKERQQKPSPLVEYQSSKVVDLLAQVKRKGAERDEKKYNRIRAAYDQNYAKLHPNKPTT